MDDARSLVQGDTDSERVFALITKETRAARGDVGAGIATAVRWIAGELPLFALNVVLVAAGELWALRLTVTRTTILDGPPRHQLTLADLRDVAAASQAP